VETLRDAESLAVAALTECGFRVTVLTSSDLRVATGGESFDVAVKVRRSATYEWDVQRLLDSTDDDILLVLPRASKAVIALAEREPRLSLVSLDARRVVWRGKRMALTGGVVESHAKPVASRRRPWGRWALMRVLALTGEAHTQADLARMAGISQPAVSQVRDRLGSLVERTAVGWRVRDRSLVWDTFMDEYAGAGGISSYWYGLDPITQQTDKVLALADALGVDALLSGDSAADRLAPWRIPAAGVVYTRSALDLRRDAFAESEPANATMTVIVPADRTIWATAAAWSPVTTADPLIVAWDLRHSGGPDARESADRIKSRVLDVRASTL